MSWCIQRKGPLYVSVFSPLLLVIVAILSWALLQEKLYEGTWVPYFPNFFFHSEFNILMILSYLLINIETWNVVVFGFVSVLWGLPWLLWDSMRYFGERTERWTMPGMEEKRSRQWKGTWKCSFLSFWNTIFIPKAKQRTAKDWHGMAIFSCASKKIGFGCPCERDG